MDQIIAYKALEEIKKTQKIKKQQQMDFIKWWK